MKCAEQLKKKKEVTAVSIRFAQSASGFASWCIRLVAVTFKQGGTRMNATTAQSYFHRYPNARQEAICEMKNCVPLISVRCTTCKNIYTRRCPSSFGVDSKNRAGFVGGVTAARCQPYICGVHT